MNIVDRINTVLAACGEAPADQILALAAYFARTALALLRIRRTAAAIWRIELAEDTLRRARRAQRRPGDQPR